MAIPNTVVLNVTGPHTIQWGVAAAVPSFTDLGRTDNDDLFSVEIEHKYMDIFTNEFGLNPAESIQMGSVAYVNFTMVSHNPQAVINMIATAGGISTGGTGPTFPTIGETTLANTNLIAFKINPGIAGNPGYTVNYCRLISHTLKDVGNKPTRVGFRFEIIRTNQTNIYTVNQ